MNKDDTNTFWLNNPKILFTGDNFKKILPENGMTRIEQMNAVTRFCIYFLILLLLFGASATWFYIAIIIILFVIALYYIYQNDPNGKYKELMDARQIYENNFGQNAEIQNY